MKSFAIALVASSVTAFATEGEYYKIFLKWATEHGRQYREVVEFQLRYHNFVQNHKNLQLINSIEGMTSTVGHNQFSDWSKKGRMDYNTYKEQEMPKASFTTVLETDGIPDSIDWRDLGAVNEVQDQGSCGSCWAFSAIASMEGQHFVQSGDLVKLSEQQCVDCDEDSYGCNGGWQDNCMWYVFDNGGIETEDEYPYEASSGLCMSDWSADMPVQVSNVNHVPGHSESQLMAAIANGPVSVTIDASSDVFFYYKSGVITDESCGTALDHAVTAVGYGTENGQDYWLVRNSWGSGWGDAGYVKIGRNGDGYGMCGIQEISYWANTN